MSLNAKIVERAALGKLELGTYSDGHGTGLILRVKKRGRKNYAFWSQRVMVDGKRKDLGLGSPPIISLAMARQKAIENKRNIITITSEILLYSIMVKVDTTKVKITKT